MHKLKYFFPDKNYLNKNMFAYPTENVQTYYPKHTYFFIWPNYK